MFRLCLPEWQKPDPKIAEKEMAAKKLYDYVNANMTAIKRATYRPENLPEVRREVQSCCEQFYRAIGDRNGSSIIWKADQVAKKSMEILNFEGTYWDNRRRGQQRRRLEELLIRFRIEWRGSHPSQSPTNVVPFRRQDKE